MAGCSLAAFRLSKPSWALLDSLTPLNPGVSNNYAPGKYANLPSSGNARIDERLLRCGKDFSRFAKQNEGSKLGLKISRTIPGGLTRRNRQNLDLFYRNTF